MNAKKIIRQTHPNTPLKITDRKMIKIHMGVSKNNGTPKSSHFNRVFHYKPSILGCQYFWKHAYGILPSKHHNNNSLNTQLRGLVHRKSSSELWTCFPGVWCNVYHGNVFPLRRETCFFTFDFGLNFKGHWNDGVFNHFCLSAQIALTPNKMGFLPVIHGVISPINGLSTKWVSGAITLLIGAP